MKWLQIGEEERRSGVEFSAKAGNETARVFSDDVGATLAVAREKAPKSTGHSEISCHSEPRSGEESRKQDFPRNLTGSFTQIDSMFFAATDRRGQAPPLRPNRNRTVGAALCGGPQTKLEVIVKVNRCGVTCGDKFLIRPLCGHLTSSLFTLHSSFPSRGGGKPLRPFGAPPLLGEA